MSLFNNIFYIFFYVLIVGEMANAQLSPTFYSTSCPNVTTTIRSVIEKPRRGDANINAKLIRLHFHDCFVNGCDGSVLLDGVESEKNAFNNINSLSGFDVVDDIKTALEGVCPGVVSCADILAIAAEISVALAGGPSWEVPLGRKDSRRASQKDAEDSLPLGSDPLERLISKFSAQGLDTNDLVALSGAHTFGKVRCGTINNRLHNFNGNGGSDPTIEPAFLQTLQQRCPREGNGDTRIDIDPTSPDTFDNNYYVNLQTNRGVIGSDQVLYSTRGAATLSAVNRFASSQSDFFEVSLGLWLTWET